MFGNRKKYKLGVALGGGGARGYAHLGVLQALSEKNIRPDIICGVSAGALAGVFLASGKSPEESFEIIKAYRLTDFTRIRLPKGGFLSLDKLKKSIEKEVAVEKLEDLKIPLIVTVTNMLTGKVEYLTEGPVATIVQASASIPVLFQPVNYQGQVYLDGGILDNIPYTPLVKKAKKVIGVSISPVQELKEAGGIIDIAARAFQLSVNTRRKDAREACDYFIEPPELSNFDLLDTNHADAIFESGYNYTKALDIRI